MANLDGKCIVCGASPTVKMHVFPRAMIFQIRGHEKHVVEGDRRKNGVRFKQSGTWDDRVLCAEHEEAFATADDYAIRLCRRISNEVRPAHSSAAYRIANPRPDLLMRFIYATVWRQVVSNEGRQFNLDLGPYRRVLEEHLFSGDPATLQALVGRSNLVTPDGKLVDFAIPPYRQKLGRWRVWHFNIGPLDVYLKTDKQPFPSSWAPYLANANDPLVLHVMDARRLDEVPMLQTLFRNMMS